MDHLLLLSIQQFLLLEGVVLPLPLFLEHLLLLRKHTLLLILFPLLQFLLNGEDSVPLLHLLLLLMLLHPLHLLLLLLVPAVELSEQHLL